MFGAKRRRRELEMLELMRNEVASARTEMRDTVSALSEQLDSRLRLEVEQRSRVNPMLVEGLERVRSEMSIRDAELHLALNQVTAACDKLGDRVHADRAEHTALADAISQLTAQLSGASARSIGAPRSTVIGGSVAPEAERATSPEALPHGYLSPSEPADDTVPIVIDLRDTVVDGNGTAAVEVHCRFGDRWVEGFEIHEIIESSNALRYRLRRSSDGYVLPTLFTDDDVRGFTRTAAHGGQEFTRSTPHVERTPW
ncbi:MAG TPA: hypothetical protein VIC35_07665 [Acidimicrobiia bacterium]|jgi:hypothetical protein